MRTCNYTLSDDEIAFFPTKKDVAFYEEHGWYISSKVIPDEVIEEAIAELNYSPLGHRG